MSATGQLEAVLNKSTRGLRKALEKEDIPFELPLNRSANDNIDPNADAMDADANNNENVLAELGKLEELQPGSTRVVQRDRIVGNARRSVLVFRGHMGVHGLFNFLLNWRDNRVEFRSRGPPMLVAPCVFLNATVKQAEITRNGTIRRMTTDPSTNRSAMQTLYRIDIDGYLLPTSLYALLLTVARAQGPEERFACALKTDERTEGLNVASEDGPGAKDGDPGSSAANGDMDGMVVGWREVVRHRGVKVVMSGTGLDGAAVVGKSEVKVVKCMGGKFEWS
ncbi:hypothetical protein BC937DRAFT_91521 [Endogone sp. FLAS-F59071]|nr:hypothetical protein BC937DRAFT_91521 [Endogone sp. FLAS-F59071]|eukprot:RUS21752.1 hypothetical protein BC937DRAFT_91521 [Endogone sp. FLAS-F59071]